MQLKIEVGRQVKEFELVAEPQLLDALLGRLDNVVAAALKSGAEVAGHIHLNGRPVRALLGRLPHAAYGSLCEVVESFLAPAAPVAPDPPADVDQTPPGNGDGDDDGPLEDNEKQTG